jgi:hypothetical protein
MALHLYNTPAYNSSQYNADSFFFTQALSESIGSVDTEISQAYKALADAVSSSDVATKYFVAATRFEFVFLSDGLSKSIINKGFSESLRINDWLQIERKSSQWN